MMNSKIMRVSLLVACMSSLICYGNDKKMKLTPLPDGSYKITFEEEDFKMAKPLPLWAVLCASTFAGAGAGYQVGKMANASSDDKLNYMALGVALINYLFTIRNYNWNQLYKETDGLTLHGCAVKNNDKGVKAHLDFTDGFFYGFRSYAFDPREYDNIRDRRTALTYAAAFNSPKALAALLDHNRMPKDFEVVVGREHTKTETKEVVTWFDWIMTLFEDGKLKRAYRDEAKSNTDKTELVRTIDDNTSCDRRTPAIWAAVVENRESLKELGLRGASITQQDNTGQSVRSLATKSKVVNDVMREIGVRDIPLDTK